MQNGINMAIKIIDIIHPESIELNTECKSKNAILEKLVELAAKTGKVTNTQEALKEVFERERIMSTGVGKGIALPHAKTIAVTESVGALITLKKPVDFDSIDNNPVNLVFLLLGKVNNVNTHLKLLSNISRMVNSESVRNSILHAENVNQILELFASSEEV